VIKSVTSVVEVVDRYLEQRQACLVFAVSHGDYALKTSIHGRPNANPCRVE
jgi:hypothetical protein